MLHCPGHLRWTRRGPQCLETFRGLCSRPTTGIMLRFALQARLRESPSFFAVTFPSFLAGIAGDIAVRRTRPRTPASKEPACSSPERPAVLSCAGLFCLRGACLQFTSVRLGTGVCNTFQWPITVSSFWLCCGSRAWITITH